MEVCFCGLDWSRKWWILHSGNNVFIVKISRRTGCRGTGRHNVDVMAKEYDVFRVYCLFLKRFFGRSAVSHPAPRFLSNGFIGKLS